MDPYTAWTAERLARLGTTRLSQLRNRPRLRTQGPPARPAPRQPSARPKPPPRSRSSSLTHLSAPELRASRPRSSLTHTDAFGGPSTYPSILADPLLTRLLTHPSTLHSRTRQNSNSSPPLLLTSDARLWDLHFITLN